MSAWQTRLEHPLLLVLHQDGPAQLALEPPKGKVSLHAACIPLKPPRPTLRPLFTRALAQGRVIAV